MYRAIAADYAAGHAEYNRRWKNARQAQGLCRQCGSPAHAYKCGARATCCKPCLDKACAHKKAKRRAKRARGVCIADGCAARAQPGRAKCARHLRLSKVKYELQVRARSERNGNQPQPPVDRPGV